VARELKFFQAINEAIDQCMARDPAVYLMGLGVPDPKGIFGTTLGLQKKYGAQRVMDMPTSENAMTGVAIGSALTGMRPIMVHQRLDFALLAMEQIVNQAAKWHYMFGGQMKVPLVIRMIIGRGWGQGPQHSQGLQSWFAHVPGLRVVMPSTPYDAKGLLIAALEEDNPVIFLEHRWLHNISGDVPEEVYRVELGKARRVVEGHDLTIVANSYMTLEALHAAQMLSADGISADVIDLRTINPLDEETILASVRKTGALIVADGAWKTAGFAAEIIARVSEQALESLRRPPVRVTFPDVPTPSSPALAVHYYPRAAEIVAQAQRMLGRRLGAQRAHPAGGIGLDVPDPSFQGPF
jgi:pyruvate dehydrogenase E1 component beta subunit